MEDLASKPTKISSRMWTLLILFGLFGQIAWAVENMYFNLFIYETIAKSTRAVTVMVQASGIVATVTTVLAGALSDKFGNRRKFISIGYIFWDIVTLAFAFITTENVQNLFNIDPSATASMFLMENGSKVIITTILIVVVMDCVMTFFGSAANDACFEAWVTDNTDKTNRGTVEGVLSTLPLVALLIVAGGFGMIKDAIGYPLMFGVLGGLISVCGVVGLFVIRDSDKLKPIKSHYIKDIFYGFRPSVIKRNYKFYVTLLAIGIYSVAYQIFMPYLIIYMEEYLGFSVIEYSIVLGGVIVLAAVSVILLGRLSDKVGRTKMMFISAAVFSVGVFSLYFVRGMNKPVLIVLMGVLGFVMILGYLLLFLLLAATVRDYTPERAAGKLQGVRMVFYVLIPMFIGPMIGDSVNQLMAKNDPATFRYFDPVTETFANVPAPQLFLWAAAVSLLIFVPLILIARFMRQDKAQKQVLFTPYAPAVIPHPEYPRPQLERASFINLNGRWNYAISDAGFNGWDGEILVPFSPEAPLSGVMRSVNPEDTLYYSREFNVEKGFLKDVTLLNFGAVDYRCTVKLNGVEIGSHRGGFTPFTLDVTSAIKEGSNTVELEVTDPTDTSFGARGKQRIGGHGIWYTSQSGIWQTVWLESVSKDYIRGLQIVPDIDNDLLEITVDSAAENIEAAAFDGGREISRTKGENGKIIIHLQDYELWSPENPKLYDLVITAGADSVKSYFGMRKFSVESDRDGIKRLFLNNKPYFHTGLLDQGYWSDGLLTPPSDAAMLADVRLAKEAGFNMLRKHIKLEPYRWYYHCDCEGVLVWQDMVSGGGEYSFWIIGALPFLGLHLKDDHYRIFGRGNKEGREEYTRDLVDTVNALKNFVSIAVWVPFNEGWGQFDSAAAAAKIREIDPTRPIDEVSGWHDQGGGEFKSLHIYFRPVTLPKDEKRAILLSEFGGYSMPVEGHMFNPEKLFGYKMFESPEKLTEGFKKLYETEVIPLVKKGLSAAVYTQLSDVEEEINGLVTYDRKVVKFDKATLKDINARVMGELSE